METFIYKIKYHCAAITIALILGALIVLPFFYFQLKLGSSFQGIFPEIVNDELFYYARIKDVVDGHSFLSNAYLYEHKDGLPQQLFLAEWLLAQPLKLLDVSINTGHLIYNFLLPTIAFLIVYTAFYFISRRRLWSLIFSVFLFFGLYPFSFIRPVSPQFNFIFYLTQFILLWLLVSNEQSKKIWILNALNFGFLFYIYPYYWSFYLVFFVLLAAIYFFKNKTLFLKIASITVGGLILAVPYFYFNYLSSHLPYYTETLTRLGMIYSHFPSGIRIFFYTFFGLALFGLALYKKIIKLDGKTLFFISGILASAIVVNQHLITGRNFEFSSHYDMGAVFFMVFAVAYLWQKLKEQYNNLKILSAILLIIVLTVVANSLYGYSKRALATNEENIYIQNYIPIFEWLNKNTKKDSVVYANSESSKLIPVYTSDNVYYVREANLFFISDKEVFDRFIVSNFFEKFDRDFVIENVRLVYGVRYIDIYGHAVQANKLRRILGLKTEQEIYLPEDAIQKVLSRAKELQSDDFIKELKQFKIDYLVWDKNKNPEWKINPKFFSEVYSKNNIVIYQFK